MPVYCQKDLDLLVTITDSSGRRLDNISSLVLDWSVSAAQLVQLVHTKELRIHTDAEAGGRKVASGESTVPAKQIYDIP